MADVEEHLAEAERLLWKVKDEDARRDDGRPVDQWIARAQAHATVALAAAEVNRQHREDLL